MAGQTDHSVALDRIGDRHEDEETLAIGAITVAAVLAGGWALAQSVGPPSGFGPPFMHGHGSDGMGPGMMKGMRHGMGPGMMKGMGPGMLHGGPGSAFADPAQIETLKGELGITAAQDVCLEQVRQGRPGRGSREEDGAGERRSELQ